MDTKLICSSYRLLQSSYSLLALVYLFILFLNSIIPHRALAHVRVSLYFNLFAISVRSAFVLYLPAAPYVWPLSRPQLLLASFLRVLFRITRFSLVLPFQPPFFPR